MSAPKSLQRDKSAQKGNCVEKISNKPIIGASQEEQIKGESFTQIESKKLVVGKTKGCGTEDVERSPLHSSVPLHPQWLTDAESQTKSLMF